MRSSYVLKNPWQAVTEREGIAFGFAHKRPLLLKKNLPLKIAFTPHINVFLNKSSIQLLIRDFKTG